MPLPFSSLPDLDGELSGHLGLFLLSESFLLPNNAFLTSVQLTYISQPKW